MDELVQWTPARTIAIFDKATTAPILGALTVARRLRGLVPYATSFRGCPVPMAIEYRDAWLPQFQAADVAACTLYRALTTPIGHRPAAAMISQMYAAIGVKPKRPMLEAVLDLVFADDVVRACGWPLPQPEAEPVAWEPINATPTTVSLAARMLIASARFEPRPSEVRQAVIHAGRQVTMAQQEAARLRDAVLELDAVLLQRDHDEWQRPYLTKRFRPLLERMLALHFNNCDGGDDDQSPFTQLVRAEQAKLALPAPGAIAACKVPPAKKTKRKR